MGVQVASGKTSVTGNVTSIPVTPITLVIQQGQRLSAGAGSTVVATVPANEKWHIVGMQYSGWASAIGENAYATFNGIQVCKIAAAGTGASYGDGTSGTTIFPTGYEMTLATGQTISLTTTANHSMTIVVFYWVEAV